MTLSSHELRTVFDACLQEGVQQSRELIRHWCTRLVDALYQQANVQPDPAQRRLIQNAIGALKEHSPFIETDFVQQLQTAVRDDLRQGTSRLSDASQRSFSALSFDQLELMGDNQVQEAVEGARLQQVIKLASDPGLAGFSARLSTAQGFPVVKADKNPLRSEVIAQAFFKLMQTVPVNSQVRAIWLTHGALLMGEELQLFFVSLDKMLARQGVRSAPYGVIPSVENRRAAEVADEPDTEPPQITSPTSPADAAQPTTRDAADKSERHKLLTVDHLHRLLVGDYDASFKAGSLPLEREFMEPVRHEFAHTVPAALDFLVELQEKGMAPVRPSPLARKAAVPLAQMRAYLKTEAKSLGQSLAIEVVGLMIEQLANDSRLLMPVRQLIAQAEPAFLRLAVSDPRFFSDKKHPARRLLDAITSASLAYASEDTPGFTEFMQSLRQTAALLTEEHAGDAEHFAGLLQRFESDQARQKQQYIEAQQRAVQALLHAEQRHLLAEKIAADIRTRPDFVAGNRIVTAFLTGPWAQVMAQERLLGDQHLSRAPHVSYGRTLDDLLWSLDMSKVADHRKRLVKIIPGMLESLTEGLQSIDYPADQSRLFFDELMMIHQAGLRAVPETGEKTGERAGEKPDSRLSEVEKLMLNADAFEASRPWLAPAEAQHSGFMDDWDDPASSQTAMSAEPPSGQEGVALRLGDWVELLVDLQWVRAQLTWISPHNTLYMFTSEGGRKHSMTGGLLQHLVGLELVKVVSQQGVVDGALDGVARAAMRNSLGPERH